MTEHDDLLATLAKDLADQALERSGREAFRDLAAAAIQVCYPEIGHVAAAYHYVVYAQMHTTTQQSAIRLLLAAMDRAAPVFADNT